MTKAKAKATTKKGNEFGSPSALTVKSAYFDQGQIPTISCIDKTKAGIPSFDGLAKALQRYVTQHLGTVWGVQANMVVGNPDLSKLPSSNWVMLFQDEPDVKDALGYHYLTRGGMPLSKIFTKLSMTEPGGLGVTASHELAEMLLDPGIQMCAVKNDGTIYAYEVADACESLYFDIDGWSMSDFVYPAWFEGFRKRGSTKFDHLSHITAPFQILRGGYMSVYRNGQWTQIFGSTKAEKAFMLQHHPRAANRAKRAVVVCP